jgi:polygalacturonase
MTKITLQDVASFTNEPSALATVNSNSAIIETASNNFLSRDGTTPNQMLGDIDMNSHRILNLTAPTNANEPLRLKDLTNFVGTGNVPTSSALITYNSGQIASVNTTVEARLRETISVHDFGAKGDGITDDTVAIAAAVAAAEASNIRTVFFPQGTYVGSTLIIAFNNIVLRGSGIAGTWLKFKIK